MMVDHIDDSREYFKNRLTPFIKFYDKLANKGLPQFMNMTSDVQTDTYNLVLVNNSLLEQLIREIQEEELNGDNSTTEE